jgi:membrane fusion protein, heavy metal efflux system
MDRDDEEVEGRAWRRQAALAAGAVLLLLLGAAGGVIWSERRSRGGSAKAQAPLTQAASSAAGATGSAGKGEEAVEIALTPDAIARAGIKIAEVNSDASTAVLTVPATVTSNAYRDTKVNALVAGIVRDVSVELGAAVRRGEPLAVIVSSDLADAQMKYVSMRAMLEADHQKLERTQKLVELGSASRQDLEEVTALHTGHETEVAAARQRLLLLGLSSDRLDRLQNAAQVVSEVTVPSPADGLVIARSVNPGQVINGGQELFVVTDLGTVWVIGDLYERDFPRVRVGSPARITVPSAPDRTMQGRVAYIDPRVDPATRTAKVRVEVSNRSGDLRLGMFVTVAFQVSSTERVTVIPRAAVQTIGDRSVVYVPAGGDEGKFVERQVRLGTPVGEFVQVIEGLKPGDKVVTEGSFFLRADAAKTR